MKTDCTRRAFLKHVGLGVSAVGLTVGRSVFAAGGERPPNLIVIMADDLGAHELGGYGHPTHRTPNLDRLGQSGVQFRTCYATPICHPTRMMIMTGQYAHHNGVYQFAGRPGGPKPDSPEEQIVNHFTFAQMLKKQGYATAHSGKWQLSGKIPDLVHEAGFDEYCMWAYTHNLPPGVKHTGGWEGKAGGKTSRYWNPSIVKNDKYLPTKEDDYGPDIFADFVVDFARRHRDKPFFIYYPMALTHAPYYTTPDTTQSLKDHFVHSKANWQANVEYTDKIVGRITAALDELGLRDNTIVFFTGDNGTGGNGKGQATEMGARVPLIVNAPGLVKPIGKSDALIDFTDIFPTLAELSGASLPADRPIDGHSFAPILRGEKEKTRDWIYSYLGGRRVLRDERWLLENNSPTRKGRFFDCGDCRDGSTYKDVTDSDDAEVVTARQRFEQLLADKPVPSVSDAGRDGKQNANRKGADSHSGLSRGGEWSSELLGLPDKWSSGFNNPVVSGDPKGLRIAVRAGEKRGVAMIPARYQLPRDATTVRLEVAAMSPDTKWLFKLAGNHDGSGKLSAAHTTEMTETGSIEFPLDKRVLAKPEEPWIVKLGLTGKPGSYVVVKGLDFLTR